MSPRRSQLADLQRERDLFQQENHRLLVEAMALRATIARLEAECQRLRRLGRLDDPPTMLGQPISDDERDAISKDGP